MALPQTIKNTATAAVIFGVPEDQTSYMILQSYDVRRNGTFADVRDETGKMVLRTNYDKDMTVTVTGVLDSGKTSSVPYRPPQADRHAALVYRHRQSFHNLT